MKSKNKSLYIIIGIVIIALVIIAVYFYTNYKSELKARCCAECTEGFPPYFDSLPYCINKEKMSQECIDYLGIQDIQGALTTNAWLDKCTG